MRVRAVDGGSTMPKMKSELGERTLMCMSRCVGEEGLSTQQVADRLDVHHVSAYRALKILQDQGKVIALCAGNRHQQRWKLA